MKMGVHKVDPFHVNFCALRGFVKKNRYYQMKNVSRCDFCVGNHTNHEWGHICKNWNWGLNRFTSDLLNQIESV